MGNTVQTKELEHVGELTGHQKPITLMTYHSGKLYTGSQDCTVRQYEPDSGLCIGVFKGHSKFISSMVISPLDGVLFSGDGGGMILSWALERQLILKTYKCHTKTISCMCLQSSGSINSKHSIMYSGSFDNTICQWDTNSGTCIRTFTGHTETITSLALSKNGKVIFSSSADKSIRKWNTEDGTCLLKMEQHEGWVWDFVVIPSTFFVFSAGMDGKIIKWNTIAGRALKQLDAHTDSISRLCLTSTRPTHLQKNAVNSTINTTDKDHDNESSNGYTLLSCSWDGTIKQWDCDSGELLQTFVGHTAKVKSMMVIMDRVLISSSEDMTVRIWDIKSGLNIYTLNNGKQFTCFCQGENTKVLFVACKDGVVRRFHLPKSKYTEKMESRKDKFFKKLNNAITQRNIEEEEENVVYGSSGAFSSGVAM
jgi:WD40 repeat protein